MTTLARRGRRRLARAVREYAKAEFTLYHRADVIELASIAARVALYERIAELLEDGDAQIGRSGVDQLETLLGDTPSFRDYGARAQLRNDHIAGILAELEGGR